MSNVLSFFQTYKKELKTIFLFFIATRIIFALMLNIGYYYLPKGDDIYNNVHNSLDIIFQFNDASNYIRIAKDGYNGSLYAFGPLYPTMIKLLSPIFLGSYEWSAFTISNISFIIVILLLFYYLIRYIGKTASMYATIALIMFPASHYNSVAYTESLFFLTILISIISYRNKDYMISAIFCGLSILTRINGIALLAAYGLDMLVNYIKQKNYNIKSTSELLKNGISFLIVVIAIYGLWLVYMYAKTGNALYFLEAQRTTWSRETPNLIAIIKTIIKLITRIFKYPALRTTLEFLCPITMLIFSIFSVKKVPIYFSFYSIFTIIMPLTTNNVDSLTRYSMLVLSAYAFIGIKSEKNKVFRIIWFLISLILFVIFTGTMGQLRATFM
ncbi:glycosyltransferase family 39 protein [Brachyspira sp. SAP_772]|uniref:glycosyltransferase family 39 protein n=1 Tax=Brachyspira sp. SAP_772 TaxID=2608385 RepID=UPI0012F50FA8|nr:glycosyltransferase family 39 protein [Brachyspira sp. SAP_772]